MAAVMSRSQVAILSAGTTMLESACVGLPTLGLSIVDNQDRAGRMWEKLRVCRFLGRLHRLSETRFLKALQVLVEDTGTAKQMAGRGRALVDGQGALRVARGILDLGLSNA